MKLYAKEKSYELYNGDMLDMKEVIKDNSIDSIVCDPPYEINFMNKGWDNSGIAFNKEAWAKCNDVLKPGGYLLAFGGSRTYHRIACAIEDAGFEIRDCIMYLYGSGFPKSMNIGKAIEAKEKFGNAGTRNKRKIEQECDSEEYTLKQTNNGAMGEIIETTRKEYIPNTNLAKQWNGWGTVLKPAYEPIIVARKPFKGSLVDNVIKNRVGGLNIDECRIRNTDDDNYDLEKRQVSKATGSDNDGHFLDQLHNQDIKHGVIEQGRFPANTILTYDDSDKDEVCGGMPDTKSEYDPNGSHQKENCRENADILKYGYKERIDSSSYNDEGSASRYFYCAKASTKDRDEGLKDFQDQVVSDGCIRSNLETARTFGANSAPRKNIHPTVKPCELMQYLIRLVTPKGGTILDPFNGSGSTGKAAMFENRERNANYKYIGIEIMPEYLPLSKSRIDYAINKYEYDKKEEIKKTGIEQLKLF